MALRREFARFLALEATRIVGMDMMDWIGQLTGKIRLKQELQRWEKCKMYMQLENFRQKRTIVAIFLLSAVHDHAEQILRADTEYAK
jgi:hypothetical protein